MLVEKRIPLSSVLNVRVVSKLKFEFELVCSVRSFRLRTPSAQAPRPTACLRATTHYLRTTCYLLTYGPRLTACSLLPAP